MSSSERQRFEYLKLVEIINNKVLRKLKAVTTEIGVKATVRLRKWELNQRVQYILDELDAAYRGGEKHVLHTYLAVYSKRERKLSATPTEISSWPMTSYMWERFSDLLGEYPKSSRTQQEPMLRSTEFRLIIH
jgi:hypothetical protein